MRAICLYNPRESTEKCLEQMKLNELIIYIYTNTYICIYVYIYVCVYIYIGFPCGSAGKESACNAGDLGSIPGLGRSPEEGKGQPTPVY